jgi:hypothetical protein
MRESEIMSSRSDSVDNYKQSRLCNSPGNDADK